MTKPVARGQSASRKTRPTRTLAVFAKLPRTGQVKTRLIPTVGAEGATRLYGAFLDDTVDMARQITGVARELWVARHPDGLRSLEERYADFAIRGQPSGDLGDRMRGVFDSTFGEGTEQVLIIGSDHPTLPGPYVRRGFEALKEAPLVLGPTEDGGYYAVGLGRDAWPRAAGLFDGIAWSTSKVLPQTRQRAEALGLRYVELPDWYDVDEPAQLARLVVDADPSSETSRALRSLGDLGQLQETASSGALQRAKREERGAGSRSARGRAS